MANARHNVHILESWHGLSAFANQNKIARIIVAMDDRRGKFPTEELLECRIDGIEIEDGLSFFERLTGRILIDKANPSTLIFCRGFKKSPLKQMLKDSIDKGLALFCLILFAPLMVAIAIAIRMDSCGPVLYRQERVGQRGKIFRLMKFRSMCENAECETGPVWAVKNDCRITRVGRIIRNLRLDELPQLFNVLKGEMSFVGPRPERPHFVDMLKEEIPYYDKRHCIKPGITGWAQIEYEYSDSIESALEKLKYDFYYIKNLNIFLDFLIIFKTLKIVFFGTGAR
jgi:sugar transferase (PEP-CTERM system associated)